LGLENFRFSGNEILSTKGGKTVMNANFMVKVEDAKLPDIQKALKAAGIKVRSIIEVYKEDVSKKKEGGNDQEEE